MSVLLLLYGIETPTADVVAPPPTPAPVAATVTGGPGGGIIAGVRSKKKTRLGEVLRHADYEVLIGLEDEDVVVVLQ